MTALRSSDLRHRLTIRRPTETDTGKGGFETSWTDLCSPWAEVIGLAGRENATDHALQGISFYRIRIWYRDGLLPSDQVRYGNIDLNVRSAVDPDGQRHELVILADTASTR